MKIILTIISFFTIHQFYAQVCVGTAGKVTWECWQNLYDDELGELYSEENYPLRPDYKLDIYKTQSPINFDNYMGGKISGFISVPSSDTVTFNITGDDKVRFYLSSNDDPANMTEEAFMDGYSNVYEHEKYPEQTSAPIYLQSGNYYYFELIYVEGGGGDHVSLFWKTDNDDPVNWTLLNSNFLNAVDCLPTVCPERGTACDDSDPTTENDMEDGFCNCLGAKIDTNSCIGERFVIKSYGYDSIPGNYLNDLYSDPDFPGMPNRGRILHRLSEQNQNTVDSCGYLIQAYLTVPVTGNYKFNITGNNDCIFFLSSDHDPANKQAHQILVTGSTDPTEHDKYIYQSTSDILLEKDKYYYIELNHKEGSWAEHFSIFWQTPFTETDIWKRIPEFYIFDYECTIACIPQGTPCDDGDPFTNNDQYDGNCNCVGTPCSGPDCNDPLASYTPFPKCDLTDQIDNRVDNNWLSCAISGNPNAPRGLTHWVQYDFGQKFIMHQSHIWNYNETGAVDQGFETVAVDYSLDGTNWTELGQYNWNLADGSADYAGFIGPDFGGVEARFVLITCLDDPASPPCRGFGKLTINAEYCDSAGDPCDDGDPDTVNDVYDEDCVCVGTMALNECINDTLSLGDTLIVMDTLSAINLIESSNIVGDGSDWIMFVSGNEISLDAGFETVLGSNFEAFIEQCNTSGADADEEPVNKSREEVISLDFLRVYQIPDSDIQIIEFYLEKPGEVVLSVNDTAGNVLFPLIRAEFKNKGWYKKRIRTKKLDTGLYHVYYNSHKKENLEDLLVNM